jgi:hypothetical protein
MDALHCAASLQQGYTLAQIAAKKAEEILKYVLHKVSYCS